ncbi:DUF421 domain-containing protein [Pedobacter faecalis]|uniref:DUF421 domain-containing protein n=1 Tax=Pedobacter faecalis TaxID=3041495 RepID=UPI00254A23FB|nr:YetF domain-containing protein [Pedobacter sp. ELA7]
MLMAIDWNAFLIGEENWEFLVEIALRTIIMYFIILLGLRLLGKRGVKQLSVFELVVIISLGSAAGDPMFYKEVGLAIPVVIFSVVVAAYRLTTYMMAKSQHFEDLVEGKPVYLVRDGEFSIDNFGKEALAYDEFFAELRQQSVAHLGQVDTAILETSGNLSVYFFPDDKVQYGLPILPEEFEKWFIKIEKGGVYACQYCGRAVELKPASEHKCKKCKRKRWVKALNVQRIR